MFELTQYDGNTLNLSEKPKKIVSLVPSVTETMIQWGTAPVARTQFCIYPKQGIKNIPHVKGTKNPDLEKIKRFKPDLIIVNKEENRLEDVAILQKNYPVWITYPDSIDSTISYMHDLSALCEDNSMSMNDIKNIERFFTKLQKNEGCNIACFIWKKPWMVAAGKTYISNLIESYSQNAFSDQDRYPVIELEALKENNVTHVFLSTEPFYFKESHKKDFQSYFDKHKLNIEVAIVNGENFTWPGPRCIDAVNEMKKILN